MAQPTVTVTAPTSPPQSRGGQHAIDQSGSSAGSGIGDQAVADLQKQRLQKRHTVTLAMSKSSERLSGLVQKKPLIRYGVYGVQGKRDAMEDAHVAITDCPPKPAERSPGGSSISPSPIEPSPPIAASPTVAPTQHADASPNDATNRKSRDKKEKKEHKKEKKNKKEKKEAAAGGELKEKKSRKATRTSRHRELPAPTQEKIPITSFFGVYDGHGDSEPSIEAAVVKAFAKTEEDFLALAAKDQWSDGTTAVIAIVDDKNKLLVANIGDSEGLLCRKGQPMILTHPHNVAKSRSEAERVTKLGGKIWNQRVAHPSMNPRLFSIAVSRSIGDLIYKNDGYTKGKVSGLISTPDIMQVDLTPDDQFLLLACDGLFDVITYKDAVDFILKHLEENNNDPELVAKQLVECAFEKGSLDNITALLVTFNLPSK